MAIPAIPAISGVGGASPTAPTKPAGGGGADKGGFGGLLTDALNKLDASQVQASNAATSIATGKSTDISAVAMSVEQASLSLQLAVQVRNKLTDAYNDLFRMQI
ncbi:MAG TPA: flagellar hook-basal body complex protein FliE [Gaiellaceae bacterium]|jgi:flagellar hook-basal body complex protein FliE|nr:flagellar hook-basal body complex protein FliE [Gaiellaceae bacterium]